MSKITFEQLLARREQREQDKYRVGLLTIPGSGEGLEARTPDKGAILQLYGELTAAQTPLEGLECGRHALYDVCPQLRDKELHAALGCQDDPMVVMDALFSVAEQDQLGGQALRFLGLLPEERSGAKSGADEDDEDGEAPEAPGLETVKN